ncbi:hypothetical protein FGO68_gene13397 [Halteria grandinella]|uniref:Uncharacterized protein n=1 Tax=Halteria grandinella TaxID=5974 RepID=A0A8J8SUX9_HALGN|nr:hypothetical protein FGO68_gene13397 [Halteria grandinella]
MIIGQFTRSGALYGNQGQGPQGLYKNSAKKYISRTYNLTNQALCHILWQSKRQISSIIQFRSHPLQRYYSKNLTQIHYLQETLHNQQNLPCIILRLPSGAAKVEIRTETNIERVFAITNGYTVTALGLSNIDTSIHLAPSKYLPEKMSLSNQSAERINHQKLIPICFHPNMQDLFVSLNQDWYYKPFVPDSFQPEKLKTPNSFVAVNLRRGLPRKPAHLHLKSIHCPMPEYRP